MDNCDKHVDKAVSNKLISIWSNKLW